MQQEDSKVSVVISTYNWPEALTHCVHRLLQQTIPPYEIIIADDGSASPTQEAVTRLTHEAAQCGVQLQHVWHEDKGYRRAAILNRAFSSVRTPYVIQMDCDCLTEPHFICDHLRVRAPGCFVAGSRVLLNSVRSTRILADDPRASLRGRVGFHFNGLRIPSLQRWLAPRYQQRSGPWYLRGCNMAFWLTDLQRINGYDERYEGWGQEDNEIAIRLLNAGVRKRFLKLGGIMYHLYHGQLSRERVEEHFVMLKKAQEQGVIRAEKGMDQYMV